MRSRCRRWGSSDLNLAAALHDLVVVGVELGAGELIEPVGRMSGRQVEEDVELAVERLEPCARQGGAGALQMGVGEPPGDPHHHRRHVLDRLGQEDMQVARGRAFAGQPLGLGRQRAHHRPVDGMAEQPEGRTQAAQRHPRLVDADRPAALQDDGAVLAEVGMAVGHDVAQRDVGRGGGGKSGIEGRHAGADRSGRKRPGNRKERQSDEGFMTCCKQHFACIFRRFRWPGRRLAATFPLVSGSGRWPRCPRVGP